MFLTWVQEKKSIPEMLVLRLDLTQAPLASLYRPWGFSVCGLLPKPFCYKPLSCQPRIQKAEKLLHMTCHVQRDARLICKPQRSILDPVICKLLCWVCRRVPKGQICPTLTKQLLCGLPEATL